MRGAPREPNGGRSFQKQEARHASPLLEPHWEAGLGHFLFDLPNAVDPVMDDTCKENGIGFAEFYGVNEVLGIASASTGNNGNL